VLMLTPWGDHVGGPAVRATTWGARTSRALADGRALRARTGGRARCARCARARHLRRRKGQGAKGPGGALGFFRRLAKWKGIQRGSALKIVFFRQLFCKGSSKSEKPPAVL